MSPLNVFPITATKQNCQALSKKEILSLNFSKHSYKFFLLLFQLKPNAFNASSFVHAHECSKV